MRKVCQKIPNEPARLGETGLSQDAGEKTLGIYKNQKQIATMRGMNRKCQSLERPQAPLENLHTKESGMFGHGLGVQALFRQTPCINEKPRRAEAGLCVQPALGQRQAEAGWSAMATVSQPPQPRIGAPRVRAWGQVRPVH